MRRSGGIPAWGLLVCIFVVLTAQAGCYQRVVDAEGMGTDGVDTYEPNVPEEGRKEESAIPIDDGRSTPG
jgi:hypothetical protein